MRVYFQEKDNKKKGRNKEGKYNFSRTNILVICCKNNYFIWIAIRMEYMVSPLKSF